MVPKSGNHSCLEYSELLLYMHFHAPGRLGVAPALTLSRLFLEACTGISLPPEKGGNLAESLRYQIHSCYDSEALPWRFEFETLPSEVHAGERFVFAIRFLPSLVREVPRIIESLKQLTLEPRSGPRGIPWSLDAIEGQHGCVFDAQDGEYTPESIGIRKLLLPDAHRIRLVFPEPIRLLIAPAASHGLGFASQALRRLKLLASHSMHLDVPLDAIRVIQKGLSMRRMRGVFASFVEVFGEAEFEAIAPSAAVGNLCGLEVTGFGQAENSGAGKVRAMVA